MNEREFLNFKKRLWVINVEVVNLLNIDIEVKSNEFIFATDVDELNNKKLCKNNY